MMEIKPYQAAIFAALFAAMAGAWTMYWITRPEPAKVEPDKPAKPLPEAPPAKGKKKVAKKPPKAVYTYRDKPIDLPGAKQSEDVIATGELDAGDGGRFNMAATLDMNTGESRVWAVRQPDPAFAFNTRGEAGIFFGPRSDGETVARAYIRQNLIQSKTWRLGGLATIDSDGEWFAGAGVAIPLW